MQNKPLNALFKNSASIMPSSLVYSQFTREHPHLSTILEYVHMDVISSARRPKRALVFRIKLSPINVSRICRFCDERKALLGHQTLTWSKLIKH